MSALEESFALQLRGAGLAAEREHPFAKHIGRMWRADFRIWLPGQLRQVLVEINGVGPQGRHGGWDHHDSDAEKLSTAAALGWRVLVLSPRMVKDGSGLALVEAALGLKAVPVKPKKPRSRVPRVKRRAGLPDRVRKAAGL